MFESGNYSAEDRFFEAFAGDFAKPSWFLGIRQALPKLDLQGVDAIAEIIYPDNSTVLVPAEVKGNRDHIDAYYRDHPMSFAAKVVIVVVFRRDSFARIRGDFFHEVERRRLNNIRYEEFFAKLERAEFGAGMRRRVAQVAANRAAREQYKEECKRQRTARAAE